MINDKTLLDPVLCRQLQERVGRAAARHGFATRMTFPCGRCGQEADLGEALIVPKEDIECHPDFAQFRAYRELGSQAYRRTSRDVKHSQPAKTEVSWTGLISGFNVFCFVPTSSCCSYIICRL